jgi:Rha family phage regulatory protein
MTDSRTVADYFGKRTADVIRDIENLDCSPEFTKRNFALSYYKDDSGKKNKMYAMTFDGFVFLVMGYRGKKAAQLKESYIAAFNKMAAFIRQLETAKLESHDFTEAIKQAHA